MSERPLSIAIIGFGNHVRKNILRLFDGTRGLMLSHIYVRDTESYSRTYPEQASLFTSDLASVLADPAVDAIYVATPISSHFIYAKAALEAGKHVICEKPLAQFLSQAEELAALAEERRLLLGEIAMYRHHRQYQAVKDLIASKAAAGERLIGIRARFSIPELPASDIRYSSELGGGALLDVGFYPLSFIVSLLGWPDELAVSGYVSPTLGVDLSGQALLRFGSVGAHCFWAIGASYANEVELSFTRSTYTVERSFSKPPELPTQIRVTGAPGQVEDALKVPADDHFENIFSVFLNSILNRDYEVFSKLINETLLSSKIINEVNNKLSTIHKM